MRHGKWLFCFSALVVGLFAELGQAADEKASPLVFPFTASQATAAQQAWAKSLGKKVVETNSLGMELVLIPAGKFTMGSPATEQDRKEDEDQADVTLTKAFWLGKTEVTQGQWQQVMGTTPWKGKDYVKEGRDYAATYVSWEDAQEFIQKLSERDGATYRLPTEAEWEWSCRAGTASRWSFGESDGDLGRYAWYGGFDGGGNTKDENYAHQVGQKLANPFGLHDMHGNVSEWCEDWYAANYYGKSPPEDPKGPPAGSSRVIRGGGWHYDAVFCRAAFRVAAPPVFRRSRIGFRVVRVSA